MIMFFAGADTKQFGNLLVKANVRGVLLSQYYSKKRPTSYFKRFIKAGSKVFIDSGGFTARIKGVPMKVEEYAEFLKKHDGAWDYCANLDVMNPDETLKNQKYLEKQGLRPIPVFHWSDVQKGRKDLMESYCKSYPFVAIGGVAATVKDREIKRRYFGFCFNLAMKYKTKLHGFGVMDEESLYEYPWFSVDSTTWLGGAKFATVYTFKDGKLYGTPVKLKEGLKENVAKLENPYQCLDSGTSQYRRRCTRNIEAIKHLETFITRLWERRGVNWDVT